jgi:hypothetical protein
MSAACFRRSPALIRARFASDVTYTDWVLMLREDCSRRQKSARAINASASSSSRWPTIAASEVRQGFQRRPDGMASDQNQQSLTTVAILAGAAFPNNRWPTPQARDGDPNGRSADPTRVGDPARHGGYNLDDWAAKFSQIQMWSTPRASDGEKGGPNQSFGAGGIPLPSQAASFLLDRGIFQAGLKLLDNDQTSLQSCEEQSMWPTPTANCVDMDTMERSGTAGYVRIAQGEAGSPYLAQVSGVLNPAFVEWMMGWPIGSTASACSATALSLFKQRMRFALSQLASPAAAPLAQLALFA